MYFLLVIPASVKQLSHQFWVCFVMKSPLTERINLTNLFGYTLVKHIAMYYERRFANLGYSAAFTFQLLPYLQVLLNESHSSDQHIEIVHMLLHSQFLNTELLMLAYFTHIVNLPFLICHCWCEFTGRTSWNHSSYFQ